MATDPGAILDQIDDYLASDGPPLEERRALWDILAGIRGPDKKKDRKELKRAVTGVIRAHAFPKFARKLGSATGDKRPDFRPTIQLDASLRNAAGMIPEKGTGHYHNHAWRAMLALAHVRQRASGKVIPPSGVPPRRVKLAGGVRRGGNGRS